MSDLDSKKTKPDRKQGETTPTALLAKRMLDDGRSLKVWEWARLFGLTRRQMSQYLHGMKGRKMYDVRVTRVKNELNTYRVAVVRCERRPLGRLLWLECIALYLVFHPLAKLRALRAKPITISAIMM